MNNNSQRNSCNNSFELQPIPVFLEKDDKISTLSQKKFDFETKKLKLKQELLLGLTQQEGIAQGKLIEASQSLNYLTHLAISLRSVNSSQDLNNIRFGRSYKSQRESSCSPRKEIDMESFAAASNMTGSPDPIKKLPNYIRMSPEVHREELSLISEIFSNSVRERDSCGTPGRDLIAETSKSESQSESDGDYSLESSYDSEIAAIYQEKESKPPKAVPPKQTLETKQNKLHQHA